MGGVPSRTEQEKKRRRAKRAIAKKLFGQGGIGHRGRKTRQELIQFGKESVPELSEQEMEDVIREMVAESNGLKKTGNAYYFKSVSEAKDYIDSLKNPITP